MADDFASMLRGFRGRAGLTQQELAVRVGVGRNTIVAWEGGIRIPRSHADLQSLSEAFHLSSDEESRLFGAAYRQREVHDRTARASPNVHVAPTTTPSRSPGIEGSHFESDELLGFLQRMSISPFPQLDRMRKNRHEYVQSVDSAISLLELPEYAGIDLASRVEVEFSSLQVDDFELPINWPELKSKYGRLRPGDTDRPKVYVVDYDLPILDRNEVVRLKLGVTSYNSNNALMTILNLNEKQPHIEQNTEGLINYSWSTFGWKHPHEWNKVFQLTNGEYIDLRYGYLENHIDFMQYMPNLVVMAPIVVTGDGKMIFALRSKSPTFFKDRWMVTIDEQIDPTQDGFDNKVLQNACERSIKEELGRVDIREAKFLSVFRDWHMGIVWIAVLVHVSQSSGQIEGIRKKTAKDPGEIHHTEFLPFTDLDTMLDILRKSNYREKQFHPVARYRLLIRAYAL